MDSDRFLLLNFATILMIITPGFTATTINGIILLIGVLSS